MNKAQKIICVIVGLAIMGMLLYPPWASYRQRYPRGYHWIGARESVPVRIDVTRLAVQVIAALVAGAVAFLVARRKK